MKAERLSLALLRGQSAVLASDCVPRFDVEALCKATATNDKANGIVLAQAFEKWMGDEAVYAAATERTVACEALLGPLSTRLLRRLAQYQTAGLRPWHALPS
jgi:hypothetical protein